MVPNLVIGGQEIYVCRNGMVYGHRKALKKRLSADGYEQVTLGVKPRRGWNVHRLVALAHLPNPDNLETVNHIDGHKCNNYIDNLEWCSRVRNVKLAQDEPVLAKSVKTAGFGLWFPCQSEAGRSGFTQANISKCVNGERPTHKGYTWEKM